MKSAATIFCTAVLVLGAGVANAGSNWIGFSGGTGFPTGDYGDVASTGWHLGVSGTHMMDSQWGLGADVAYHSWSGSKDFDTFAETTFGPGSEFKWTGVQATGHAVMGFPTQGSVKPYAKVGLGLYNMNLKLSSPSGDDNTSKSKLGFNLGGGVNFASQGNMRWGVAGAYHIVPTKDDLGSDVDFFTLGANVMWGVSK